MASTWAQEDQRSNKRAAFKVKDVDAHVKYYEENFGMKLIRKGSNGDAFVGYGSEADNFVLQVQKHDGDFDIGQGFGHFGIVSQDVYETAAKVKASGSGKITREAGPVKGGKTVIAFAEDPSGYKWELIQREPSPEPLCQVMLRVDDLEKSIKFYQDALGMTHIRSRDNPEYKYTLAFMGYGPEESSAVMELTWNYGTSSYTKGNSYEHVEISTSDLKRTAEDLTAKGYAVTEEAGGVSVLDPNGYKYIFTQS